MENDLRSKGANIWWNSSGEVSLKVFYTQRPQRIARSDVYA
jgi:hypothetical protein